MIKFPPRATPVSYLWASFHQGKHLYHNANNLPLWTWWQPPHQITLPLWHQGKREDQEVLSHCCLYSPWVLSEISDWAPPLYMPRCTNMLMLPLSTCKVCKSITWIYTSISQPSGNRPFLDSSTQPSGHILNFYTWLNNKNNYIIHPMHSGVTKYIIWTHKDQGPKHDHDSYQQLSYTIWSRP